MARYQTTMRIRMMPGYNDANARDRLLMEAEALEAGEITPPYQIDSEGFRALPISIDGYWRKVATIGGKYEVHAQSVPLMLQRGEHLWPVTVRITAI